MDSMNFPKTVAEFIEQYSFADKEEVYTNGATLIPVYRVEQMVEHYFSNCGAKMDGDGNG